MQNESESVRAAAPAAADVAPLPRTARQKAVSALNWIAFFLILALVVAFFAGAFPVAPLIVATGSMEPEIGVGDIVLIWPVDPDKLEVGDVIRYQGEQGSVIHKVIAIEGQGTDALSLTTKGVANNGKDRDPVTRDQVRGKVVWILPNAGTWLLRLHGYSVD